MFRRVTGALSARFPPKFVADRILPWLTVTLAAIGGFWAIYEYRNDVGTARIKTVLDLHQRYTADLKEELDGDVSLESRKVDAILELRCNFYKEKIMSGQLQPGSHLPECSAISSSDAVILQEYTPQMTPPLRTELRNRMNEILATEFAFNYEWTDALSRFFRSVIVCVERHNCDRDTSIALFAKEMTSFLNSVCPHERRLSLGGRNETIFIANFLIESGVYDNMYWSSDNNRENLFSCDYLRDLSRS